MTDPFEGTPFNFAPPPPPPPRRRRVWPIILVPLAVLVVVVLAVAAFVILRGDLPGVARGNAEVTLGLQPGSLSRDNSATVRSLQRFWGAEMPSTYNKQFVDLRGGYQPKTLASPSFSCGGQVQDYRAIVGNAFYCGSPQDDYMAWDAEQLFPQMDRTFGSISPAIVLAHEMGHAIQARANVEAQSIVVELQADCFAGAWTAFADQSGDDPVALDDNALDGAVAAVLTLRDQPGTPAINPQAHGSGFDRVNAFQTGFEGGARRCAQFENERLTTTQFPFRTREEALTGGNLPFRQAVPVLATTLDEFWSANITALKEGVAFQPPERAAVLSPPLPECPDQSVSTANRGAVYCPPTNTVAWADSALLPIHERIGDMASGSILSDQWGRAGQLQAALPADGRDPGLQRDCMTGAWIGVIADEGVEGALLSPGDVDEALTTIIISTFSVEGARADRGDAFTRTRAFRAGVLEGPATCRTIAEKL